MKSLIATYHRWRERRERSRLEKETLRLFGAACFCPKCRWVVNGSEARVLCFNGPEAVTYQCKKCGTNSEWDWAHYPVPVLIRVNGTRMH